MNPLIQSKNKTILPVLITLTLACFALSPTAKAQLAQPASDGGYPGGDTVTSTVEADTAAPLATPTPYPHKTVINYSLVPGANSAAITPAPNVPALVMGVCTSLDFRGVGQVTLLHIPRSFIEWAGLESTAGASITQGFSGFVGTHIVYIDYSHQVDIQVASPDTIRVHNASGALRTGKLTLVW
jgi:hypothetical protein